MLMRLDGVVAEKNVLHELRRVADHLWTAECGWRSDHADEAIPGLRNAIVRDAWRDQCVVLFS